MNNIDTRSNFDPIGSSLTLRGNTFQAYPTTPNYVNAFTRGGMGLIILLLILSLTFIITKGRSTDGCKKGEKCPFCDGDHS